MGKRRLTNEEVLKDLEENRNHSLYEEIRSRNITHLNKNALFYRGEYITYNVVLEKMFKYAKSLKSIGITKGMKIPICSSNTPEFVYLLGACSIIGAVPKIFGEGFDKSYITEILNSNPLNIAFMSDNKYESLIEPLNNSNVEKVFMFSLCDSLQNGQNPYEEIDNKFYKFENKIDNYKAIDNRITSMSDLENKGRLYSGDIFENITLDDVATITYSSGSTNATKPKAIVHGVRSYIAMGRNHDPEVSGVPSMKNLKVLAHIPTHSNTDVQAITDSLIQGSTICLEPSLYSKESILASLLINKPNFACVTRTFCVSLAKELIELKKNKTKVELKFLLSLMAVGEPLSIGEEKTINKVLKFSKAGTDVTHTPNSITCVSTAGGDCEHGGILFQMFRSLTNVTKKIKPDQLESMRSFPMVDIISVDENGKKLKHGQLGRLVAASPATMLEYENNPEATKKFFVNVDGKTYGDMSVYGYTYPNGQYVVKGRIGNDILPTPPFQISDAILKDTKKVMSCEAIPFDNGYYVVHLEMQPGVKADYKIMVSALKRIESLLGKSVADKVFFKVRGAGISFPDTGCGKRNKNKLEAEGFSNSFKLVENNNSYHLLWAEEYLQQVDEKSNNIKECK